MDQQISEQMSKDESDDYEKNWGADIHFKLDIHAKDVKQLLSKVSQMRTVHDNTLACVKLFPNDQMIMAHLNKNTMYTFSVDVMSKPCLSKQKQSKKRKRRIHRL